MSGPWWLLLGLLAGAPPSPAALLPCTPGLAVTYRVEEGGRDTGVRITDLVRGPREKDGLCVLDRETLRPGRPEPNQRERDAFARELLPDRVLNAGWLSTLMAFRPPLLVAPLEVGRTWRFNRVEYRVAAVEPRCAVPAGSFGRCVRVEERALDESGHQANVLYAEGVGPVRVERGARVQLAERVITETGGVGSGRGAPAEPKQGGAEERSGGGPRGEAARSRPSGAAGTPPPAR